LHRLRRCRSHLLDRLRQLRRKFHLFQKTQLRLLLQSGLLQVQLTLWVPLRRSRQIPLRLLLQIRLRLQVQLRQWVQLRQIPLHRLRPLIRLRL
jgi:hypothetical protein